MAGVREVRCVGPSYRLADPRAASQRTVNMYLSAVEAANEDRQFILKSVPGLYSQFGITEGYPLRAMVSNGVENYVLNANTVQKFTLSGGSWASTNVGVPLSTISGPARMALGRDQLVIVDGSDGWVLNLTSGVMTQISDPDWRGSYDVESLDGYFIFVDPNSSDQFYISAIDDASSLDALDFSSSDVLPDDLITIRAHKRELYLFNRRSVEVWINSPTGADFPFVRFNSSPIEVGIVGRKAVTRGADTLFFVGQTERGRAVVYMMAGHQPRPVSNAVVEAALLDADVELSECVMWAYQIAGAEFVGLEAPGMETTWVYDARTGQWHEQGRLVDGVWSPMGFIEAAAFGAQIWVLTESEMFSLTDETFDIGGYETELVRERTWPHLIAPSAEPVKYSSLELLCKTGVERTFGSRTGLAMVTLEVSNDGGHTFGSPLIRSLGATGRYMQRIRWHFLGQARDRVFRLRCSDNVDFTIYGAQVDAS